MVLLPRNVRGAEFRAFLERVLSDPVAHHAFWSRRYSTPEKVRSGAEYRRRRRHR